MYGEIRVYFNSHLNTFSVQTKGDEGWRVSEHLSSDDFILISNPTFVVRKSGRDRVLKERKKNVHAWVEGKRVYIYPGYSSLNYDLVRYNPYVAPSFLTSSGSSIHTSDVAFMAIVDSRPLIVSGMKQNDHSSRYPESIQCRRLLEASLERRVGSRAEFQSIAV